jgi:NTP pyrophosphatase (non-canonical NTP hydrolase)
MNLHELQADLRHFAAERDRQPLHTPKNLSTALIVEAAKLAEVFQWMTPEESRTAHQDPASKQRIAESVADVLLSLMQLADHSEIDIAQAVKDALACNASKHPAKRTIARNSRVRTPAARTLVLLDYENVQPTEGELRAMVPDASEAWVFHGPHQRRIEQRFPSFGNDVTAVPISRTGKNALDFHLSFYTGYIASRNQGSTIVVVANDKGYRPMVEHARALGFKVRQQGHRRPTPGASKKVPTKAASLAAAKRPASAKPADASRSTVPSSAPSTRDSPPVPVELLKKVAINLRKMNDKRPAKAASLRRTLKSFLGVETGDESIEVALDKLIAGGVIALSAKGDVSYPGIATVGVCVGAQREPCEPSHKEPFERPALRRDP